MRGTQDIDLLIEATAADRIDRALMRANRKALRVEELRTYFELFEREPLLDELLRNADEPS